MVGDSGLPLWEEEVGVDSRLTLSIASSADREVLVFPGKGTAQDRVSCSWAIKKIKWVRRELRSRGYPYL